MNNRLRSIVIGSRRRSKNLDARGFYLQQKAHILSHSLHDVEQVISHARHKLLLTVSSGWYELETRFPVVVDRGVDDTALDSWTVDSSTSVTLETWPSEEASTWMGGLLSIVTTEAGAAWLFDTILNLGKYLVNGQLHLRACTLLWGRRLKPGVGNFTLNVQTPQMQTDSCCGGVSVTAPAYSETQISTGLSK